ncbi:MULTISPECIES: hypothetical protein [unclassified Bacillus (in: firmicutes)]|uniref:hypothetical protein n=1 Tax=unclassified Bacillus (in: firmicutes) TaxID=185979 RepID=UPI001BEB1BF7|nr:MULTISPECIES: hypothetical protein [unclassified Bacillus (in: firmicutes)]MBT2614433.1 hypothetical protein [Bacillus sp. ISL-78]MBT2628512.1 hypothetical protein [Bacillus sp. ISL-101]
MASVDEVIYRSGTNEVKVNVESMSAKDYEEKYRENLYCAFTGCEAKMSYVYDSKLNRGYFRNWRHEQHSADCDYFTANVKSKSGSYKEGEVFGILSKKQKYASLDRAFDLLLMTEEEKKKKRDERRKKPKKEKTIETSPKPDTKIVLDLSDESTLAKVDDEVKPRLGSSKTADRLNDTDLRKTKTVYGFLESVSLENGKFAITIIHQNVIVDVIFEEVFTANSPGASGYFHHIKKYFEEYEKVPFAVLGEIRKNRTTGRFEVRVYDSESLKIDRMTLLSLAAFYSLGESS